jgi:hypothetical protein
MGSISLSWFSIDEFSPLSAKAESIARQGDVEVFRKQWDQRYLRDHF